MCLINGHVGSIVCLIKGTRWWYMVCLINGTRWEYSVFNYGTRWRYGVFN